MKTFLPTYANKDIAKILLPKVLKGSMPRSAQLHLIENGPRTRMFVVNGSRMYDISNELAGKLDDLMTKGEELAIHALLDKYGFLEPAYINDVPLKSPPLRALSLAIAQKCNMGCTYCYADQGDFGGPMKNMDAETTYRAIDLLLDDCPAGERVQLTFLGGEPLLNRPMIRAATLYASQKASAKQLKISFSITSNGTLMTPEDAVFFEKYGFSVTISLDGLGKAHDQLRPMKGGQGSFDQILEKIQPLLAIQNKMQVSARVTVTPENMDLADTLDAFIGMGFHSVGFSPLLNSMSGKGEMTEKELESMLEAMIECGLNFEKHTLMDLRYPFLNMVNSFKELTKQTHRPYPCGAGAGYMGVSADGDLAACHRFVNEPAGKMGSLKEGVDHELQDNWLSGRHVHQQTPCNGCWARYLCGGGCHHEVLDKGRNACNYIRSWLHYSIQAQERLQTVGTPHI